MWLMKNGDQVVVQTYDNLFHKLNISQNTHHNIITDKKTNELEFVMTNCGRNFSVSNQGAQYIDYDLIDRIIHSVCVDTVRH